MAHVRGHRIGHGGHLPHTDLQKYIDFIKKNIVMFVAFIAALMTTFVVPVDIEYIGYFDFKTLTCLFCVLAVVCAFKNINFFYIIAKSIVKYFKTARVCVIALLYITFIGSMLIANDMALLTFLPLGFFVLSTTGKKKYMATTFILQNISANLGGMLTPFGNPQNLYLYTKFNIPTAEYVAVMAPPFVVSIVLITLCCFFVKNEQLEIADEPVRLDMKKVIIYSLLFILSIAIVFRSIHYLIGLLIIPAVLFFMDRKALKDVDYGLLLTFVFFFIFSGNMARITVVRQFFSFLLEKNTLIVSALSCQFISNVPSAILLSQFTENYRALLVGVNIGGVGTLISSLASLITFREYSKYAPHKIRSYIVKFSAFNFAFLIILLVVESIIL